MKKSLAFLLSCLLLLSLVGCSGQSGKGSSQGSNPQRKTQEISNTTRAEIEDALATEEGKNIRDKKFDELVDGKVDKDQRLDQKTKKAADFLGSYYVDLWQGSAEQKARATREALFLDAAQELVERLQHLTEKFNLSKISPLYDIRNQNDEFAFYAISIAMDKNLRGVLENALIADRDKKEMDSHLSVFVQAENRNLTVALLEARMNILSALALKLLTSNAKSNFGQNLEGLLKAASFSHLKQLDVPEVLVAEDQVHSLLTSALKTKTFLKSVGVEASLEKNLKSSFRHVKENKTRTDLMALVRELLK